uniref:Uncharacterized protein n=1 Tax=Tanacetum cinerariifolium TaxID=118510 RepID=A0A699IS81_TANCI|nr:hypothetical protein [Tanacetum cinerariifolium]
MKKVVEDVSEDEDFKSGTWVSATDYVNANGGISCSPNVTNGHTVTMKDLPDTIPETTHHKVISGGGYGKDVTASGFETNNRDIEKNSRDIKTNGGDIKTNSRDVEMYGRMIVLRVMGSSN